MKNSEHIKRAIVEHGGFDLLASEFGVTRATLYNWIHRGYVEPKNVIAFHKRTGLPLNLCNQNLYPLSLGLVIFERE